MKLIETTKQWKAVKNNNVCKSRLKSGRQKKIKSFQTELPRNARKAMQRPLKTSRKVKLTQERWFHCSALLSIACTIMFCIKESSKISITCDLNIKVKL